MSRCPYKIFVSSVGFGTLTTRTRKTASLSFIQRCGTFAGLSISMSFVQLACSFPISTMPVPSSV